MIYKRCKCLHRRFYGLLRRSETIALQNGDLSFDYLDGECFAILRKTRSKADQAGRGADVYLAAEGFPISATLYSRQQSLRDSGLGSEHPLFPSWLSSHEALGFCPLRDGQTLGDRLHFYLGQLHVLYPALPLNTALYGLRRGGATAAWENGVDQLLLKGHGRWRGDAMDVYLAASVSQRMKVSKTM